MAAPKKKRTVIIRRIEAEHAAGHGGSWKVAYADFVTALMALFLLMWLLMALKPQQKESLAVFFQNPEDVAKLKTGLRSGAPVPIKSKDARHELSKVANVAQVQKEITDKLKDFATRDPNLARQVGVIQDKNGLLIKVPSSVLFPPGAPALTPEAMRLLAEVAGIMNQYDMALQIRGHTDDRETGGGLYPTKWELSASRAASALQALVERLGVSARRMEAIGLADTMPLVPNDTEDNRARNRRLELLFTVPEN